MPSKYATLGLQASAADRWLYCTASPGYIVANADKIVEETADYTDEGIKAHSYAEAVLMKGTPPEVTAEMHAYVMEYVEFVRSKVTPASTLLVEQWVPLHYMPERTGKIDSLVLTFEAGRLVIDITDLKYGQGVSVEAVKNVQQTIYVVSCIYWLLDSGLIDEADLAAALIRIVIHQPRARDKRVVRQWNLRWDELLKFYTEGDDGIPGLLPTAKAIIADPSPEKHTFHPSDDTCRFCPMKRDCTARLNGAVEQLPAEVQASVKAVLSLPDVSTLSVDSLSKILGVAKPLEKFFEDARKRAFGLLEGGTTVPGYKLVTGKSSRSWKDEEAAKKLLKQKFDTEQVCPPSLVSPAQAEKLIKSLPEEPSTRWRNLFDGLIQKSEGKPTIVDDSDPRPALVFNDTSAFQNLDAADAATDLV